MADGRELHVNDPVSGPDSLKEMQYKHTDYHFEQLKETSLFLPGKVSPKASTAAVILAGGSGERLGIPGGKQLLDLLGYPVLSWSIEAFDAVPDVGCIVVVCPESRTDEYYEKAVEPYSFATPIIMAPAGTIRQESSFNGVEAVPDEFEFIAIHDGARPLVAPNIIAHTISALKGNIDADGVVVGHPAVDTLKVISGFSIIGTPDRTAFWVAQTPQIFRAEVIRQAHASAMADGFVGTDDSGLVERISGNMVLVEGPRDNIKVTVPEDLAPVEAILVSHLKRLS